MRILLLSPRQNWPPHSGSKLRTYHFARILGVRAEVTHLFFSDAGAPAPAPSDLPFCRAIVRVPAPERFTPAKIVRGLLGRWPLPVVHYLSREMKAAVARLAIPGAFDVVQIDSIHLAPYARLIRERTGAPIVYDWHNIESELMRRYAADAGSRARSLYAAMTARKLAAVEKNALKEGYGHIVCSERDRKELLRIAPDSRIAVVENGVDTRFYEDMSAYAGGRNRILFVGHMAYHANIQAAASFVRTIWPRIRERFPQWTLTLAGSNPPAAVLALRGERNVEVTGSVPDLRPYYRQAVAAIIPLRVGGGTRLKILEAMASGTPVVSTTIGAEGLPVSPGTDILIADADQDWLRHLAALSAQDGAWTGFASAGRRFVLRYDWEALGESLWGTYAGWFGPMAARAASAASRR